MLRVQVSGRKRLRKETDYEIRFRCVGGIGIVREEVWVDADGKVIQYSLTLILPHLASIDNGRVLGFDNAHGVHERHSMGEVSEVEYDGYLATAAVLQGSGGSAEKL